MTEQERIDLLKEVARVAPEGLGTKMQTHSVRFYLNHPRINWTELMLLDDASDGCAIIVMLDAMGEADWVEAVVLVTPSEQFGGKYRCVVNSKDTRLEEYDWDHLPYVRSVPERSEIGLGGTRAEAVARAFVETFESRVVEDGFGGAWKKCDKPDCDLCVVRPGKVQCSCEGV